MQAKIPVIPPKANIGLGVMQNSEPIPYILVKQPNPYILEPQPNYFQNQPSDEDQARFGVY